MAEKYQWVNGVLGTDFLQLKTTDGIYLKDLLEGSIFPLLSLYNEEITALERLLCYKYEDAVANSKQLWISSSMKRLSALEQPGSKRTVDSWNRPMPIARFGDATNITLELIKQMSSRQLENWAQGIILADKKNLIKAAFQNMMTKAPAGAVDELTSIAATPKAFWNDESGMDTPRPNGQYTFDGDHDHYKVYNGVGSSGANLLALMALVHEHEGMSGQGILWAGPGSTGVGLIQAETTYYKPLIIQPQLLSSPGVPYNQGGAAQALVQGLFKLGFNVNIVGTYHRALVVETPDVPANYIAYTMYTGDNSELAPMGWREHPAFRGLLLWSDTMSNPIIGLDAQYRRYLAMNVWNRDAGAVMFNSSGGVWVEPTFA